MVCGTVCIFSKVDVKMFCSLGIIVISCPVEFDCADVVVEEMEFREVELVAYAQLNKNVFVGMKLC